MWFVAKACGSGTEEEISGVTRWILCGCTHKNRLEKGYGAQLIVGADEGAVLAAAGTKLTDKGAKG